VARPLVVAGLLGVLGGAGLYTLSYAQGLSYLSDDPRACANCHVMRENYDSWQKASHHGVATCNDCHLPHHSVIAKYAVKAENGFWHSTRFTLQDFVEPIRARPVSRDVVLANCLRCHGDMVGTLHEAGAHEPGDAGCIRCHDAVGHGPIR
jgi:cytochrome c nitrite reductase small subunit